MVQSLWEIQVTTRLLSCVFGYECTWRFAAILCNVPKIYCQTFENILSKRLKTPLSTLDNTFIKRWIILLSNIG